MEQFLGTGRRKKSVARVRIFAGSGNITINKRDIEEYFGYETLKMLVKSPLVLTEKLGSYDVAVNVQKLVFTGKKLDQKTYYHHSGYPGGLKETSYRHMMERKPEFLFKEAVRRMLPKNKLGDKMLTKLHVYAGAEHNHQAQCPVKVEL